MSNNGRPFGGVDETARWIIAAATHRVASLGWVLGARGEGRCSELHPLNHGLGRKGAWVPKAKRYFTSILSKRVRTCEIIF